MITKREMWRTITDGFYHTKPTETYNDFTHTFDPATVQWHKSVVMAASIFRNIDPRFKTLPFFKGCGAI